MGIRKHVRAGRLVVLGGALLALLALSLAWGHRAGTPVVADAPHPGLNFSITVPDVDGCETTAGDVTCYIDPGSDFTLNVSLDSLPDGIDYYRGFDIEIAYAGVTSADNASMEAWPDCAFPAPFFGPGLVALGCAVGPEPPSRSNYTGVIATNDFTCTESGTISLVHGVDTGHTALWDTDRVGHGEGEETMETLTIVCGEPPTPTATPVPPTSTVPPAAPPPVGSGASGEGVDAGLWAIIGALLAAGAAGLAVSGWRVARSR